MATRAKRHCSEQAEPVSVLVSVEELRQRRPISVYRAGKVVARRGELLCLVRSISSRALVAETRHALSAGERVAFDLGNASREGTVSAAENGTISIAFDAPIDVQAWLDAGGPQHRRAGPRIAVEARARLQLGSQVLFVVVRNISQEGLGIETEDILAEGDELKVALRGWHGTIPGTISRVAGDFAAIRFHRPLGFDVLSDWLAEHGQLRGHPGEGGYEIARS